MVGVDLVYIPEFKKQLDVAGDKLISRAFNPSELKSMKIEHLAGIWAAKEAVIKAADVVPSKMTEILISYDKNGKPSAKLEKVSFAISIAHHGDYAVAVALRTK